MWDLIIALAWAIPAFALAFGLAVLIVGCIQSSRDSRREDAHTAELEAQSNRRYLCPNCGLDYSAAEYVDVNGECWNCCVKLEEVK